MHESSNPLERWLATEPLLGAPGDEAALAEALARALRATPAADADAARQALQHQLAAIDGLRGALLRLLERADRAKALADWQHAFGAEWRAEQAARLAERWPDEPATALDDWRRAFCEALAAWHLDACEALLRDVPLPRRAALVVEADALQALRTEPDPAALAWLDRMTAAGGPLADESCAPTRLRLMALQARVLMQALNDADGAAATLEAAGAARGSVGALLDSARGELLRRRGLRADAQAAFDQSLGAAPELPDACVGRALLAADDGRDDEADAWFDRALACVVDAPDPLAALGRRRAPCPARLLLRLERELRSERPRHAAAALDRALADGELTGEARAEALLRRADTRLETGDAPATDAERRAAESDRRAAASELLAAARPLVADQPLRAARLQGRAAELAPDDPQGHWVEADSLYLASYRDQAPYVDRALIDEAQVAWERGAALGAPRKPFEWAYLTRAVIAERQSLLDDAGRETLLWEAVRWTESLLVLDPQHAYAWVCLSRLHRALRNDRCALAAALRASDLGPQSLGSLEEAVIMLANTRRYAEVQGLLGEWRRLGGAAGWIDAVEAHVVLWGPGESTPQDWQRALTLTETSLDPNWSWARYDRGSLRLRLGDLDGARREWQLLADQAGSEQAPERTDVGNACVMCGRFDAALALAARMRDDLSSREAGVTLEAAAHLMRGDLPAARQRFGELFASADRTTIGDWLTGSAADLRGVLAAQPESAERLALLDSVEADARTAMQARPLLDTPVVELQQRLGPQPRPGALASLARSLCSEQREAEALALHAQLAEAHGAPWRQAVGATLLAWFERDPGPGFQAAFAAHPQAAADWQPLGLRLAGTGSLPLPLRRQALREVAGSLLQESGADAAPAALVAALPTDAATTWALDDALAGLPDDPGLADFALRARDALALRLADSMVLQPAAALTDSYVQAVAPLRLYLGRGLTGLLTADTFEREVGAPLRLRLLAAMGVDLPEIALQDCSAQSDLDEACLIARDDLTVAYASIPSGRCFSPLPVAALVERGLAAQHLSDAAHPAGDATGSWIAEPALAAAASAEVECWTDPWHYLRVFLESRLRPLLPDLLDVAGTLRWLRRGDDSSTPEFGALCREIGADPAALHALARLLRALLAEGVPLTRRETLVSAWRRGVAAGEGFDALLRRLRAAVRDSLPGVESPAVTLPAEIEAEFRVWQEQQQGRAFLAVPLGDLGELLSELRSLIEGAPSGAALVVEHAELRAPLRRVTAVEHPALPLLAADERAAS